MTPFSGAGLCLNYVVRISFNMINMDTYVIFCDVDSKPPTLIVYIV